MLAADPSSVPLINLFLRIQLNLSDSTSPQKWLISHNPHFLTEHYHHILLVLCPQILCYHQNGCLPLHFSPIKFKKFPTPILQHRSCVCRQNWPLHRSHHFTGQLQPCKIYDITLKLQSRSIILVQRPPLFPKDSRIAPVSFPHCFPSHPLIFPSRLLEYIRQMANLLVSTNNIDEQTRLEEQFYHHDQHFIVPKNGNPTLEAIFRAISFEYYQNSPSALAQKIIAFTENMINSVCSLASLREILEAVKNQEDRLSLMHKYFWEINRELGDKQIAKEELGLSEDCSLAQENDRLFDLASKGELRLTRSLETTDFHEVFQTSMKHYCPLSISEKTQVPSMNSINPQENKEKLDSSNQFTFHTAENYYGNDWWKAQKVSDSSKQISKFDCKASNPFSQKSIGRLVVDEFRYDLNRQIQLGKEVNKHQEVEGFKYKKMMKDKLLNAKLKKKKKK